MSDLAERIKKQISRLPHGEYKDDYGKGFVACVTAVEKIIDEEAAKEPKGNEESYQHTIYLLNQEVQRLNELLAQQPIVRSAEEVAENALEKQINGGWNHCSERLPITENKNQKRVAVLVTTDTGFIETMYYEFENKMFWTTRGECNRERWKYDRKDFKVFAWMPLLSPYKEDKQL